MDDGTCYIVYNDSTIYAFPNLRCSEGQLLPSYSSTDRWTYYTYNGRLYLSNKTTVQSSSYNNYSTYVSHIYDSKNNLSLDANSFILPAVLFVIAFFAIIYRWFIRLRG